MQHALKSFWLSFIRWFDSEAGLVDGDFNHQKPLDKKLEVLRCMPFVLVHLVCFAVIWVGWSPIAVVVCLLSFWLRMFAITAFYHRYFAHRSFKASRGWQFVFAVLGNSAAQRGPLWWASHHRNHHKFSDTDRDIHSPVRHGFLWSHFGWFMSQQAYPTDYTVIKDFAKYPELRFLNRFDALVPAVYGTALFGLGWLLEIFAPSLGTGAWQMLIWGFFISTVFLFHAVFTINSLGHVWGKRRFKTKDDSRNNGFLALLTLGEGWHNNHHRFAVSTRQGFYWWEIDISYAILKLMSWMGIVHSLNPVPKRILNEGRVLDRDKAKDVRYEKGDEHG